MSNAADTKDRQSFFKESSQMCLFFSQVIFKELSEETIKQLAVSDLSGETGNEYLDQGYELMRRYFAYMSNDPRTELACEYARIFLASGLNTETRDIATPYESVFTSEEQLVMQGARDDVYRWYLQDGFKVEPSLHEPEDHLAFELEYLASMSKRTAELIEVAEQEGGFASHGEDEITLNIARQVSFIEEHLLNWIPSLRKTAQNYAQLTFYIGVLLVIEGFLREYLQELESMLVSYKSPVCSMSIAS